MNTKPKLFIIGLVSLLSTACTVYDTNVRNERGRPTLYNDISEVGPVAGIGIESQDLTAMTDLMMRDILTSPELAGRSVAPRVIIDGEYFSNESSSRLNKKMITDRLRILLNRAASGRMFFIGRHYSHMVNRERKLKREGMVDTGTTGLAKKTAGADFRLGGRISSMDSRTQSGYTSRYHQIIFEMVELETGGIVWSNMYEFKKTAQDDIVYR